MDEQKKQQDNPDIVFLYRSNPRYDRIVDAVRSMTSKTVETITTPIGVEPKDFDENMQTDLENRIMQYGTDDAFLLEELPPIVRDFTLGDFVSRPYDFLYNDEPFSTFEEAESLEEKYISQEESVKNAARVMKENGLDTVVLNIGVYTTQRNDDAWFYGCKLGEHGYIYDTPEGLVEYNANKRLISDDIHSQEVFDAIVKPTVEWLKSEGLDVKIGIADFDDKKMLVFDDFNELEVVSSSESNELYRHQSGQSLRDAARVFPDYTVEADPTEGVALFSDTHFQDINERSGLTYFAQGHCGSAYFRNEDLSVGLPVSDVAERIVKEYDL